MLKIGDKIKLTDPYSVFYGDVLTVSKYNGNGQFICTTKKNPCGYRIVRANGEGKEWFFVEVNNE